MNSPIYREIRHSISLAGPLILAQLATVSLGFIDTLMVGRLGQLHLAAAALGSATFFPLFVVCIGVLTAVSPMVSQAFGARKPGETGRAARQGLWLAAVLSIPAFLILRHVEPVLAFTGQDPEVRQLAAAYLRAMAFGFPAAIAFNALRNFVEGYGHVRPVMLITFAGVICNIFANYTLMFGHLGFPAMGLVGTGWASVVVYWTMLFALALYVSRESLFTSAAVFSRLGRPDWAIFRELLRIGLPAGALMGVEAGLFAATALLMGRLGALELASHQIAIQCAAIAFMVPLGISIATSVRVGQSIGRNDVRGARLSGYVGMALGTSFMLLTALAFWLLPRSIVSLYLPLDEPANAPVIALAVKLLGIAAVFQVFDGLQATASGALRGAKDTRVPMFVGIVSYWAIGLTAGIVLAFPMEMGARGLWWGLVLGLAVAGLLLFPRFQQVMRRLVTEDLNGRDSYPQTPITTSTS